MPTDKIPDDIAALLREARATDVPPAGAKDRVWAKTMARIDAPAPAPAPGAGAGALASGIRIAALTGFATGTLLGIVGTVAVVMLLAPPPERVHEPAPVPVEADTHVALAPTPTPAPVSTPKRAPVNVLVAPTPVPAATAATAPERATERAWLDAARTALARKDTDAAMQSLETARLRFPEGTLSEEREALGIHVLIARGDAESARQAVDTFRKRHDGSLFLPAIEEAMREMESHQ